MSPALSLLVVGALGVVIAAVCVAVLRAAGARPGLARRLAGPPEVRVGRLAEAEAGRTVRVVGRIRCRDPLVADDGERLVAFHRDVEVRVGGRWRTIERLRETRSFELWDHDGSATVDPSAAAEPLVTIPKVWRGHPDQLNEPHASAAARMAERFGPAAEARAATRTINVTDRLLVLARAAREGDRVRLEPPAGGFVISALELPDAMRLLAGPRRRAVTASVVGIGVGVALAAVGLVGALGVAVLGA